MMMTALMKLSNCAASTSSTTTSAKAKVIATPLDVSFSAAASPMIVDAHARPAAAAAPSVFELVHRLAEVDAGRERRVDRHGAALALARQLRRDRPLRHGDEGGERHHAARRRRARRCFRGRRDRRSCRRAPARAPGWRRRRRRYSPISRPSRSVASVVPSVSTETPRSEAASRSMVMASSGCVVS